MRTLINVSIVGLNILLVFAAVAALAAVIVLGPVLIELLVDKSLSLMPVAWRQAKHQAEWQKRSDHAGDDARDKRR